VKKNPHMRLFVAIPLPASLWPEIQTVQNQLLASSVRCRLTKLENLHLTLAFLGEVSVDKLDELQELLKSIKAPAFSLTTKSLEFFKGQNGDTWVLTFEESKALTKLAQKLRRLLDSHGFAVDHKRFKAHVTLARGVLLKRYELTTKLSLTFVAQAMHLYASILNDKGPRYDSLYEIPFKEEP